MTQQAAALIGLAVLVSLTQWLFMVATAHVDVIAIPATARTRVRWLVANSAHIHLTCAGTVLAVVLVQGAVLLG
jgi:hypothetical protein